MPPAVKEYFEMSLIPPQKERCWTVLLIGGASGVGKTSVSYRLARHFDVGITEADDLNVGLRRMTTPEQQPALHYWDTHPEAGELTPEGIMQLHLATGCVMSPMVEAVIENHLEGGVPLVLEGDYLLPELTAQTQFGSEPNGGRVRGVFLHEPDEAQILRNFKAREPDAGEQHKRARVSWLFGEWLRQECERYGIPALPARPHDTLFDRILTEIA